MASSNWQSELKRVWASAVEGGVRSILLSPRGKVAAATGGALVLHDGPPGFARRRELAPHGASGVAAAVFAGKAGAELVSGGGDGGLVWTAVESGEPAGAARLPLADGAAPGGVDELAASKAGLVAAASGRCARVGGRAGQPPCPPPPRPRARAVGRARRAAAAVRPPNLRPPLPAPPAPAACCASLAQAASCCTRCRRPAAGRCTSSRGWTTRA
jgi:hypothetical protein